MIKIIVCWLYRSWLHQEMVSMHDAAAVVTCYILLHVTCNSSCSYMYLIHVHVYHERNKFWNDCGNLGKGILMPFDSWPFLTLWELHLILTGTLSLFPSITLCSCSSSPRIVLIKRGQLHPLTTFTRRPPLKTTNLIPYGLWTFTVH